MLVFVVFFESSLLLLLLLLFIVGAEAEVGIEVEEVAVEEAEAALHVPAVEVVSAAVCAAG